MELQEIKYSVEEGIAIITLHRPDQLNAFTARMVNELLAALEEVDRDDDVKVAILTGGGKAFSAGAVDYITKPIQHEEALARISTHLTIRRLRAWGLRNGRGGGVMVLRR